MFAEEITEGPLAGKMALYADVEPTESLVELVKKGQKLFTSMEVSPKFADTAKPTWSAWLPLMTLPVWALKC